MDLKHLVILAIQVSILCIVFGFGSRAAPGDLLYLVRQPGLLLRSLFSVLVVMPIAGMTLSRTFNVRPEAEIALIALAISPVPPILPGKEARVGGQQSYGLALMVVLALLSVVAIPAAAEILQRVFHRPLGVAPGAIARIALMSTVLPLLAGMVVRATMPELADRIDGPIALIAKVLLPLAVVVLFAGTWRAVWAAVGDGTVVALAVFVAAGLVVGHILGGPDRNHSAVLALSTACRHPAIALAVTSANFPDRSFLGIIELYVIVAAVVGMPYGAWQHAQARRSIVV
jgi:BASS family bile acid:Na+ symporter